MRSPEDSSDDASVAYSYNFPGIEKMRMHSAEPICSLLGVWRLIMFVEILTIDNLQNCFMHYLQVHRLLRYRLNLFSKLISTLLSFLPPEVLPANYLGPEMLGGHQRSRTLESRASHITHSSPPQLHVLESTPQHRSTSS